MAFSWNAVSPAETAHAVHGGRAVCIFVNDHADRLCLEALRELGVKYFALPRAGFNGIDVAAAKQLGFSVTRVPASSPNAEAEQAIALLLALNRKIPRASNRVLDLNLSQGQDSRYRWHRKDRAHYRADPARLRHEGAGLQSV